MKNSLRRRLSRYLMLSALLAALGASGSLWLFGEVYFRSYYAVAEQAGLENIKSRLDLFDLILLRAEQDILAPGTLALAELGRRFPTEAALAGLTVGELSAWASRLGVDDIYFIRKDGQIFASSFEADLGLDLFSLGPRFSASLKTLLGRGIVGNQRLTQSTKTGELNVYQYYSPPGSEFLIEVSSEIGTALARSYAGYEYSGLVRLAFGDRGTSPERKPAVRLVDLIGDGGGALWSLLETGARRDEYADLVARARMQLPARTVSGGLETIVFSVPLEPLNAAIAQDRRFAIVEIDRQLLYKYRQFAFVALVLSCVLAFMISGSIANRGFARLVVVRVENLERAIARAAKESADFCMDASGDDEISSIARGVDSLVQQVRRRATEREALNARLAAELDARAGREADFARTLSDQRALMRELNHRVKNNMQVILSLVGLQSGNETDGRALRALESTRSRLYAMSLVMDRLHSRSDVAHLPLDGFLRDLAYYLDSLHRRPGFFATIRTDGADLVLAADAAVPIGLMLGELVSNSLLHAFPDRSAGLIDITAAASDNGGFTLRVSDDGIGGSLEEGVGLQVVRVLAIQLDASLSVESGDGRTTRIEVPRTSVAP